MQETIDFFRLYNNHVLCSLIYRRRSIYSFFLELMGNVQLYRRKLRAIPLVDPQR